MKEAASFGGAVSTIFATLALKQPESNKKFLAVVDGQQNSSGRGD